MKGILRAGVTFSHILSKSVFATKSGGKKIEGMVKFVAILNFVFRMN